MKACRKFLKEVEKRELFPSEIKINQFEKECKKLNKRKTNPQFVKRVTGRLGISTQSKERLDLENLIKLLKGNGIENEKDQLIILENTLQALSGLSAGTFESAVNFGIKNYCLKKKNKKGKVIIVLISEEIEDDVSEVDVHEEEKKIGKQIFKIIKEDGFENDKNELFSREGNILRQLKLSAADGNYRKALEFCKEQGCLRTYQDRNKTVIVLLKDKFIEIAPAGIVELMERVIKVVKTSKQETEEGFLFMTEEMCLKKLEISPLKLKKAVKHGLREDKLKFEEIKDVKIVVYTNERRVSLKHL